MPVQVSGTNANPNWGSISGFNATKGALQTVFLSHNVGVGPDGQLRRGKVADGMNPISKSIGINAAFELEDGWKITENGRFTANSGGFISPFPSEVGTAASIASSFGAGSTLSFANTGTAFNNPNGLVARIHMFDTQLNDFNNFMNDLKISKNFDKVALTAGYFKSIQNISMSWMWNSYLQEVSDNNARLINVRNGAGNLLSQNGLYAYGVDMGKVTGSFAGSSQSAIDINNDGIISAPETSVSSINTANTTAVNYDYNYVSYSFGANYALNNSQSFFARYSKGASAKADRVLFERPAASYLNGDLINSLDYLAQAELGYKHKFSGGYVYGTFFYAKTDEQSGFEATNPSMLTQNNYKSLGLEVESAYNVSNNVDLRGSFTYTKAEITSGSNAGNAPRRQPKLMYNLIPSYKFSKTNSAGVSFMGQTQAFAQDSNQLVMNGFVLINGFVELGITKGLSLNISGNNLLDTLAITEVEEGSITENTVNYVRARPFPGRSISMALSYKF